MFHFMFHVFKCHVVSCVIVLGGMAGLTTPIYAQEDRVFKRVESSGEVRGRQLKPLMHKGKPIFPIGGWHLPRPRSGEGGKFMTLEEVRSGGWTASLMNLNLKDEAEADTKDFLTRADAAGLAVIINVSHLVHGNQQEQLRQKINTFSPFPAVLGYYIFDEPENVYYASDEYKASAEYKNSGGGKQAAGRTPLGSFIRREIGWARPLINRNDPDRYAMMTIAWENFYKEFGSLSDVNVPNTYPTVNTKEEFPAELARMVYDAKLAAAAAFSHGDGMGFVFMPNATDINTGMEKYRSPTVNEFRYMAFAPITQGAMGMMFFAAYRCTGEYTQDVIFPVTRQLNDLSPFFLGEWLDRRLHCEPSSSDSEILKKFKLPTISGCLRRADDGRYLLLAVNNTPKEVAATFHINLKNLPADANEFITGQTVPITGRKIRAKMPPFAVRAYIIEESDKPLP